MGAHAYLEDSHRSLSSPTFNAWSLLEQRSMASFIETKHVVERRTRPPLFAKCEGLGADMDRSLRYISTYHPCSGDPEIYSAKKLAQLP